MPRPRDYTALYMPRWAANEIRAMKTWLREASRAGVLPREVIEYLGARTAGRRSIGATVGVVCMLAKRQLGIHVRGIPDQINLKNTPRRILIDGKWIDTP